MNNKDCPHNHNSPLGPGHDFDDNFSTKCGHGCGYSERNIIEDLTRQIEQLKAKSNQRKRTLHNHKNKWQQAKKLLIQVRPTLNEDDYKNNTIAKKWSDDLDKLIKVKK